MTELMTGIATRADFVELEEAAQLAGVSPAQLERLARARWPRVIAIMDANGRLRLPHWQFRGPVWAAVPGLAEALHGNAHSVLSWLETPHGAFEGRTPRAALEMGTPHARVLSVAMWGE